MVFLRIVVFAFNFSVLCFDRFASSSNAAKLFKIAVSRDCTLTVLSRANGPRILKIGLPKLDREPDFDHIHITASENVLVSGNKDAYTVIQLPSENVAGTSTTEIEVPPDCNIVVNDESHNGELQVEVSQLENRAISVRNARGKSKFSKVKTSKLQAASESVSFLDNCTVNQCSLQNESIELVAKMLHADELSVCCDRLDARIDAVYTRLARFVYENGSLQSKFSHGSFEIERRGCDFGQIQLGCVNGNADIRVPHSKCELHAFAFKFERFTAELLDGDAHVDLAAQDFDELFEFHSPESGAISDPEHLKIQLLAPRIELTRAIRLDERSSAVAARESQHTVFRDELLGSLVSSNALTNVRRSLKAAVQTGTVKLGITSWPDWLLRERRRTDTGSK